LERTLDGDRPLAGASVNAWVQTATMGYSHWYLNGPSYSDAQGRYELGKLPEGAQFQLEVFRSGFSTQCAPAPLVIAGNQRLDAFLVAESRVSAARDSVPPSAPGLRVITGVVYSVVDGVRTPSGAASVQYEPTWDSPAALTITDAQGRFLLCGIPQNRPAWLGAFIGGKYAYVEVPAGADATVDLDVK
jgi:hypothetical protein